MYLRTLAFLFTGTAAQGAIQHTLDELKVIEAPISRQGLTRIAVKEDRILNVFGMAGEYVLETDEENGQIFIRPTGYEISNVSKTGSHSIHLTLTTEGGNTQDLRLVPQDRAPESIILKADNEVGEEITREKLAQAPVFREEVEALIQACQTKQIPLGYKEMLLTLVNLNETAFLLREIQGQKLRGLTYKIQNKTDEAIVFSESEFAKSLPLKPHSLIAILLPKKTLQPGEGAEAYVVARTY